jgi:PKD repeat protein
MYNLDFTCSETPKVGEIVKFTIGIANDDGPEAAASVTWDFGEAGLDRPQVTTLESSDFSTLAEKTHRFASAGIKTVSLTVMVGGNEITVTKDVEVIGE